MNFTDNIDDNPFNYRDSFKYFCLKNCVRQLLSLNIEDSFAYINCVPCIYVYFSKQLPDGYTIRYNKSPLQKEYESFFITIEPKQKCAERNFESILKTIDKQTPVIAATDVFFLPYKQYHNKYHAAHAIIIHGYDEGHKNIYVIDCYDRDNYHGPLSYEDFFLSWSSDNPSEANPFSGSPINNVWSFLKPIDTQKSNKELIQNSLVSIMETFHGRSGKRCFIGLDGLIRLKDHIENRIRKGLDISVERLHKSLYMYFREKVLLKDYLNVYSDCIGSVDSILASLENNLLCWKVFLTYFLKLSVINRTIALDKFIALFEETISSEEKLFESITNAKKLIEVYL